MSVELIAGLAFGSLVAVALAVTVIKMLAKGSFEHGESRARADKLAAEAEEIARTDAIEAQPLPDDAAAAWGAYARDRMQDTDTM